MKAQASFEYYFSLVLFIMFATYIVFQTISITSVYRREIRNRLLKTEAYQISELLVNDLGEPINWAQTSSWLTGWRYRRAITIDNTANPNTLTNYQVLVNLDTASLISQGKINQSCSDIRFTDSEGNLISYWIESGCNSANTKIWVKVPSIPASSTKTIYVYYGNPSAASLSSFENTFVKAGFNNTDISLGSDTSINVCPSSTTINYWTNYCRADHTSGEGPEKRDDTNGISGHDGYVYMSAASWNYRGMYQTVDITGYIPFRLAFNGRSNPTSAGTCIPCGISATCGTSTLSLIYLNASDGEIGQTLFWWYYYGLTSSQITTSCGILNYQLTGGDSWTYYVFTGDNNLISASINRQQIAKIRIKTSIYSGSSSYATQRFDDFEVYLRKYTSPEPATSIGGEESPSTVEIRRIGLSSELRNTTNLISVIKLQTFNQTCSSDYNFVAKKLGVSQDYQFEINITNLTSNIILASCSPPTRISRENIAEVTRIAALDSGSYVKITVRVW
jgi:hypothetical protein